MSKYDKRKQLIFSDIFSELKNKIADSNLSMQELSDNSNVSEELLSIFFDNSNNIVNDLSRLLEFMQVKLYLRQDTFKPYTVLNKSKKIGIIQRVIKPKCKIDYNFATDEMFNFRSKIEISDINKQLIINESYEFITNWRSK